MVDAYIVDSGVFLRWFVKQPGYQHALDLQQAFVAGSVILETADFARVELAGVLRKKALLTGLLSRDEFHASVRVIDDLGVFVHATDVDRLERAAELATRFMLRMYDALFTQLALDRNLPLLTNDAKLCRAVSGVIRTELLRGSVPATCE